MLRVSRRGSRQKSASSSRRPGARTKYAALSPRPEQISDSAALWINDAAPMSHRRWLHGSSQRAVPTRDTHRPWVTAVKYYSTITSRSSGGS